MYLADTKPSPPPSDPFKTEYKPKPKKDNVIEKINHMTLSATKSTMAEQDGPGVRNAHNCRWTTIEN